MVDDPGRQLLAEIEEEVQRKRASGDLPADFERQLDRAFAELAPEGALDGDFSSLMDSLEATATIDTDASTESSRPGVAQLKRVVGKAIEWDLRHLASEVSRVNHRLVRAVQLLEDRIRTLEDSNAAGGPALPPEVAALGTTPLPEGPWVAEAIEGLDGVPGRILLAECRHGSLLAALQSSGMDAYGVEPTPLFVVATETAVDVRHEAAGAHLRSLPRASLGGVILAGCTDTSAPAALVQLVDVALTRLVPGGRILVISASPTAPTDEDNVVAYDLAPGRPLHPETWVALLLARGFRAPRARPASRRGSEPYAVIASC